MSSRLPTSALRRSVSSSIVSRNSWRASGVQSTSRCSRLVTEALMAEIGVRRSWETAASSAARSSLAADSPPATCASASSSPRWTDGCELLGEGVEHALVLAANGFALRVRAGARRRARWSRCSLRGSRGRGRRWPPRSASRHRAGGARRHRRARGRGRGLRVARRPSRSRRAVRALRPRRGHGHLPRRGGRRGRRSWRRSRRQQRRRRAQGRPRASVIVSVWWGSMKK